MTTMTITEYWNSEGIPRGEIKGRFTYRDCGYASVADGVKELSSRFKPKLVHVGKNEVVYDEGLYVQRVSFN
jgi:hypothetical protein